MPPWAVSEENLYDFTRLDEAIILAEKDLEKARQARKHNYDRKGITEEERANLLNNVVMRSFILEVLQQKRREGKHD